MSEDVASLVQEARRAASAVREQTTERGLGFGDKKVVPVQILARMADDYDALCDALEEREREVERLRIPRHGYEEMCARFAENIQECIGRLNAAKAEVERLKKENAAMRVRLDEHYVAGHDREIDVAMDEGASREREENG